MFSTSNKSANIFNSVFSGMLAGMLAGFTASFFDTIQVAAAVKSFSSTSAILLQAITRTGLTGALLGALAGLVVFVGKKISPNKRFGVIILSGIAFSPYALWISRKLFEGGTMSRLPANTALVVLSTVAILTALATVTVFSLRLIEHADKNGALIKTALVLLLGGLLLWCCDSYLYRRLYLYIHTSLGLYTLACFAMVFRLTLLRGPITMRRLGTGAGAGIACLAMFAVALKTFDSSQLVKVAAHEHTATLADVLRVTSFKKPKSDTHPSDEIRRVQRERTHRATVASSGNWPVFPRAHILMITVDALRADRMGIYGNKIRDLTSNLDKWAQDSAVIFDRSYCTAPHSSYSISSLHTSRYTHDEALLVDKLTFPTIAEVLKKNDYQTFAYYTEGIFFTHGDKVRHYRDNHFGFEFPTHGDPPAKQLSNAGIHAIDKIVSDGNKPSFLWIHYFSVHEPYNSTRFGDSANDRYDGEIFTVDAEVIRLIDHAEQAFDGNVIVVFSADHGEEFGDHGGYYHGSSLYEEQIRVPLMVKVPDVHPRRIHTPVSAVSVAPTLLRLVGIDAPASISGQDLRPAVFGGDKAHVVQPVFSSVAHRHMALKWPWKLIADTSKDIYELYNLDIDPLEKINRFDREPVKSSELQQEIYAWLDTLGKNENANAAVINLGKMHDLRAIPGLFDLALNETAPTKDRVKAIKLLGELHDKDDIHKLRPLLQDYDDEIVIAVALALGKTNDAHGQELLRELLCDKDQGIHDRAAMALALLKDTHAVPALLEALDRENEIFNEQAIRQLGKLGDRRAVTSLIKRLSVMRTRYLVVLALGKLGGPGVYKALMNVLETEKYADTRGYTVVALGWLGNRSAIPKLVRVLREEPEIKWTGEALVRLGAVGSAPLFGTDAAFGEAALGRGFGQCQEKPLIVHGDFLERTTCRTKGKSATLNLVTDTLNKATVLIRARHLIDADHAIKLSVEVDGKSIGHAMLEENSKEFRISTPAQTWSRGVNKVVLSLEQKGAFELDHFLVLTNE